MALTDAERAKVRRRLGWPSRFHQTNSALEMAMDALASEPEEEQEARDLLTAMDTLDTELTSARKRLKFRGVGEIEGPGALEIATLRAEGRRLVARLSALLGVKPLVNPYSGGTGGSNVMRTG
jgi:hypothetical protein